MMSLETIGYYSDEPGSQQHPPLFRYFYPDRANFIAFVANLRSRRALREAEYGPLSDTAFLREISPLFKADQIQTPLLIVQVSV